jgi:ribonuclease P protein component
LTSNHLTTIKQRAEFLAITARGQKCATTGMVVQTLKQQQNPTTIRLGLTASRKVGNAVARNRARRRLRALAREVMIGHAKAGHDYVLVARTATVTRDYAALRNDLIHALQRLGVWQE